MATISGKLKGLNNSDKSTKFLEPGTYNYELKATGKGRVALKIKETVHDAARERSTVLVKKNKIRGGATLSGTFTVSKNDNGPDQTEVKFTFTKPVGGKSISYKLTYSKR